MINLNLIENEIELLEEQLENEIELLEEQLENEIELLEELIKFYKKEYIL